MRADRRRRSAMWRFIYLFGSLKMAMWLFIVLIIACAIGTLYESRFDAQIARYYVYEAPWFTVWLVLLCITLACATFTRLPWKKKHTGFIITHLGIIILLIGGMIGRHSGIEGSITLRVGEPPQRHMVTQQMALNFWGSGGDLYLVDFPVNLKPPSEHRPHRVSLNTERPTLAGAFQRAYTNIFRQPPREPTLMFDRFSEHLSEEISLVPNPGSGNPGVRLSLNSGMMGGQELDVLLVESPANRSFENLEGLAQISLVEEIRQADATGQGGMPLLQILPLERDRIAYGISGSHGEFREGVLETGERLETGWADWVVALEQALPEAEYRREVFETNGAASAGASVTERGLTGVRGWLDLGDGRRGEPEWFIAGETESVSVGGEVVRFGFGNRRIPLPFSVALEAFDVPRDPGTENPAAFVSTLVFHDPETGERVRDTAGMNQPAMYPQGFHRLFTGLTYKFSQAHWEPDDLSLSVVQVLWDPGWSLKWIGSLILISGIFIIFYVRPYRNRRPEDAIDDALKNRKWNPS